MNKTDFFNKTVATYKELGALPLLTYSQLRLELPIVSNLTLYTFPVLFGQNSTLWNVQNNEVRLQQNDNFHPRTIAFYVAITTAATDTNYDLKSYPNEVEFGAATARDMRNIYNGNLNINVDQKDVLTFHRISQHFLVPQTQRISVAANTNRDQIDLSKDGIIELEPSIMLGGEKTNTITLTLPNPVTNATAANNSRMIIIFDGLRAQNASKKQ